jgi:hypothetical protein
MKYISFCYCHMYIFLTPSDDPNGRRQFEAEKSAIHKFRNNSEVTMDTRHGGLPINEGYRYLADGHNEEL